MTPRERLEEAVEDADDCPDNRLLTALGDNATFGDLRSLLASQDHAPSAGEVQGTTDAERFQYLLDHHAYHYAMTVVEPSPAEWGIEWQYQQTKPGEEQLSFRDLIDRDIQWRAEQDADEPPPPEGER